MGLANPQAQQSKGPRLLHSKDLSPSDVKAFGGEWVEFANWWTMLRNALTSASPEWRTILDRLHEYPKHRITEADHEFIVGKSDVTVQRAYSNELFRIVHARTAGAWKAQVVVATEDNIFDIIKQWLLTGKDRSVLGQMEIRKMIVDPRKATNINDYAKAVAEWDANVAKLKGYGGELPNPQDLLASYMKLLDNDSRAYAIDKI